MVRDMYKLTATFEESTLARMLILLNHTEQKSKEFSVSFLFSLTFNVYICTSKWGEGNINDNYLSFLLVYYFENYALILKFLDMFFLTELF